MVHVDEKRCIGCALCVPACPEGAVSCFGSPEVGENCTECLICVDYCPAGALSGGESREKDHGPHEL